MIRNLLFTSILLLCATILSYGQQYKSESFLAKGNTYKLSVPSEGIYQIDYNLLSGIDGLDPAALSTEQIHLLTNDYGIVPEKNSEFRIDDLTPIHYWSEGLEDGSFDANDRILFYLGSPDNINFLNSKAQVKKNPYDFNNYVFLHISDASIEDEIVTQDFTFETDLEVSEYLHFIHHEQELLNLQDYVVGQHGSGKRWFGESFSINRKRDYSYLLESAPPIAEGSQVHLNFGFAARSGSGARVKVSVNGSNSTFNINKTYISNGESPVAVAIEDQIQFQSDQIEQLELEFLPSSNLDEAWLDYLTVNYFTNAPDISSFAILQNPEATSKTGTFILEGQNSNLVVWNITKPDQIYALKIKSGQNGVYFIDSAHQEVQRYVAFYPEQNFENPTFVREVPFQNLHAMEGANCLVVYDRAFEQAVDLWIAHRSRSGMKIKKAEVNAIYNEFSGGALDPAAIRDLARMLYQRDSSFQYLLLFGDGSFDYRYINKNNPFNNYVPVYETDNSLSPISSYPTDDFYGLLSPNEGGSIEGALELSIGRLPVNSADEAMDVVQKIIRYEEATESLGDWRLRNVFLADDEDGNRHLKDGNEIAESVRNNSIFNIEKIYFDAYPQISQAGGIRIPGASAQLDESIFKGSLIITYLGHGGPFGMAQERILDISQIQSWTNTHKLPLFVTATCSFAPYDDPTIFSAGEILVNKANGGSIGLFTTVRPVYSTSNKRLTKAVHNRILENLENKELTMGDVLRLAKNSNSQDTLAPNARKFTLLGDPTLKLAIPDFKVITTTVNGQNAQLETDTAGPLSITRISGYIADEYGDILTSFNGELSPTVFDKVSRRETLGQDPRSYKYKYDVQDNVLWKGKVPVVNGAFDFTFVLPKSMDPEFGNGRISYYASSSELNQDAAGAYDNLIIGGFPDDSLATDEPPEIELYLNNRLFKDGDQVGPNAFLYAELSDDIGINLSSNDLGKEITAFLDNNGANPIILNSFFQPSLDDYRAGTLRYPLNNLSPGMHELRLRAWDVTGNFTEKSIRFEVIDSEQKDVVSFGAYPNPFSNATCFRLKTTLPPGNYDTELQIMDINGKLQETISQNILLEGSEVSCIEWSPGQNGHRVMMPGLYFGRLKIMQTSNNTPIYTAVDKLIYID